WRARLAVVNQTPFLFSDTVANNIALGKPDATQAQIERVALARPVGGGQSDAIFILRYRRQ
ncbi:hypothetical protein C5706_33095, partial [Klebsiella pneumoniae]